MILPVVAYGHHVLRNRSEEIDQNYPDLDQFIRDLYETMYASEGVGLAAPQVNRSIRLFVIDADPYGSHDATAKDFTRVFINPLIISREGNEWQTDEGCLSLPGIREVVSRKEKILIRYFDQDWNLHEEEYNGILARIIQHEYDHLEGILFIDHISNLRKMMIKRKLQDISTGNIKAEYQMIFPQRKRGKK